MNKLPMTPNKNLVIHFPCDFSGCGILRSVIPDMFLNAEYGQDKKYVGTCSMHFTKDGSYLSQAKILKFQKQVSPQQRDYVRDLMEGKAANPNLLTFKTIYDIDDLMTDLPEYNFGGQMYYNVNTEWRESYPDIVNMMDEFTCTTQYLADHLRNEVLIDKTKPIHIVPNYLPRFIYDRYWDDRSQPKIWNHKKPRVVWSGSGTHFDGRNPGDMIIVKELMMHTAKEFDWVIIGSRPPFVELNKVMRKAIKFVPWNRNLYAYPMGAVKVEADFGLAPLLDNPFNRAKSNLKLLEYCAFQTLAICTDIDNYKEAQLHLPADWRDLRDMIRALFADTKKRGELISNQNKLINKYWMETEGVKHYAKIFGING